MTALLSNESDHLARLLIIDHHDSYTLNLLISLIQATECTSSQLLSRLVVLPHNHRLLADIDTFRQQLLPHLDGIILGPGPGQPSNEKDFGPAHNILSSILKKEISIPLLGICLGHQGIATACGGTVVQAESLRHGLASRIIVSGQQAGTLALPSVFEGLQGSGPMEMIRYNSLTVDEPTLPSDLVVSAWSHDPSSSALPPKKNDYFPNGSTTLSSSSSPSSNPTQRVVMGIQHRSLPLWGVQFHPESISSKGGEKIFKQFLINCRKFWTQELSAGRSMSAKEKAYARLASWHRLEALPETIRKLSSPLVACTSSSVVSPFHPKARERFRVVSRVMEGNAPPYERSSAVFERVFGGGNGDINTVWLDSSRPGDPQSRFSYMSKPSWSIKYNLAEREASICIPGKGKEATSRIYKVGSSSLSSPEVNLVHGLMTPKSSRASSPDGGKKSNEDFWTWISSLQKSFQACTSHEERRACPFQTGFVGYFDYEMKEESLTRGKEGLAQPIPPSARSDHGRPAAWFGFCDRVLAYDHQINQWRAFVLLRLNEEELEDERIASLQSALEEKGSALGMTKKEASLWFTELQDQLSTIALDGGDTEEEGELPPLSVTHDQASTYRAKVEAAREYIRRGESYEICLTTQFRGTLSPEAKDGFQIYRGLRRKNPAPYSAYLNLGHGSSILSTSPERFMSIEHDGTVEMRPIKGTLARAGYREGEEGRLEGKRAGNAEDTRWCQSEDERRTAALACDPKEMAENLMIVDLIRADLLAFCAPDTVKVPSLMQVESYESVHQLVTTIVGQKNEAVSSVEALKHCFPPGSMTGAPKVRSVEILQRLEAEPRGVYSGTLGWLGLDGAANFSVVIRTVVVEGRQVSIGGGGAITYLSEAEREWQEVLDKVNSIASTHDS